MSEWTEEDEKRHRKRQERLKKEFRKVRADGTTLDEELDLRCIQLDAEMDGW